MDGHSPSSISARDLYARLGTAAAPVLVDIRRAPAFAESDAMIVGAVRRLPDEVEAWRRDLAPSRPVVVHCVRGHEVSQNAARTLAASGLDAAYLEGGIEAWQAEGLPLRRKRGASPGKWVARERPMIDRIACPWLVRRFIDPEAEFVYVPADRVRRSAEETGATPYDIDGVEFSHEGERCSFDTFLRLYGIRDPALDRLAEIVRGADTSRHDLAPQCAGLFAVSLGLSANFPDDHEMLEHGMVVYDALHTWCRSLQHETHNWPAKAQA